MIWVILGLLVLGVVGGLVQPSPGFVGDGDLGELAARFELQGAPPPDRRKPAAARRVTGHPGTADRQRIL